MSFPVQRDEHFYTVLRYVERNALRAGLVDRAEDWRWSSLWAGLGRAGRAGAAASLATALTMAPSRISLKEVALR